MEKVGFFLLNLNFITLLFKSNSLSLEARWPAGEYSLPKPKTGCPDNSWKEGWLRQEMENDDINDKINVKSKFSSNFHMNASIVNGTESGQYEFVDREFCTKNLTFGNKTIWKYWPKGMYCIYQKNDCPYDLDEGWIQLDDEDNFDGVNRNKHRGILPKFSQRISNLGATRLFYCCQTKGQWYNPVELPTEKPFYLLPYKTPNCQRVWWMVSSLEYIVYDTENDMNGDKFFGHHVYTNKVKSLPKIFYCYYAGCRYELHGNTGLFKSPNVNNSFSDFHSCSWSIKVDSTRKISLKKSSTGFGFYARYATFANIRNPKPVTTKNTLSTSSYVTNGTNGTYRSQEENMFDEERKRKPLLKILLPILTLGFVVVLGVVFFVYFKRRKQSPAFQEDIADRKISNNEMYENPDFLTSNQDQSGNDDVNSKETSNPIYGSKFNVIYSTVKDLELFNANVNVLYEPGNTQENSLQIDRDDPEFGKRYSNVK
ncbi:uncharacterized protein LOC124435463 isoform X3 [Xenia sp. Carnegie-2017]|uniref:uncharacterized protein LOC124435463 isoform X3 n=1 Tax=Xenia sp. Carnegie-2017 TaxID=2897299 RepID=UPI001F047087|nr:uncharacterized protein LOC124435463 isoform X3 [Xenia sp. Carnegie-2017]